MLLKATAGGGGKGMRAVESPAEMAAAFATASAEAEASFKDGRMYVEKLIRSPRHIEVQVLGDEYGDVVHLGERDCSVQKPSHQKLIEEAPAPALDPGRARPAARHRGDGGRAREVHERRDARVSRRRRPSVYFMEMNTRIQVEHPVTEMVYGVDLVKEQIRIAAGEPLGFTQADLHTKRLRDRSARQRRRS